MPTNEVEEKPTSESIAAYVKSNAARARKAQQMNHGDGTITREADYKGHHIVVRTRYEIEVDGMPLMGHMGVNDAGSVHFHPIPNLTFASALDMVRKIIDVFPADFAPGAKPAPMPGMKSASKGMPGMTMTKKSASKNAAKPAKKGKA